MSDRKDGGPAFPVTDMQSASPKDLKEMAAMARGMSLRDHFAAKAMQGICASETHLDRIGSFAGAALTAYELADAMLKAREQ